MQINQKQIPLRSLKVVSFDPSFRNWGSCTASLDIYEDAKPRLSITGLDVFKTTKSKPRGLSQAQWDIQNILGTYKSCIEALKGADILCVETPTGSQSATAAKGVGVVLGVLGALEALKIPTIYVTPIAVKKASVNDSEASKKDMVDWAITMHPEAPFPTKVQKGITSLVMDKAEHMADAIAVIHAAAALPKFSEILESFKNQNQGIT